VPSPARPEHLYHLAIADEWEAARASGGPYERSTIGRSLADEGFIHCSFAGQVQGVADRFYGGRTDVVLLVVDPARLDGEVRVEDVVGAGEAFPHLYGPLPLGAVVRVVAVPVDADGRLAVTALLDRRSTRS
jgi:glutathione S-transferase